MNARTNTISRLIQAGFRLHVGRPRNDQRKPLIHPKLGKVFVGPHGAVYGLAPDLRKFILG